MQLSIQLIIYATLLTLLVAREVVESTCDDPLVCYLNSLEFHLPDFCATLSNGKDLCIEDFTCDGVQISSIPSYYQSPTTLGFGVHGLGTACAAKTKYGRLPGEVSVAIKDTTIDADLFIHKKGEYANQLRLKHCNVSSIYVGVDFSDPILEAFAGEISAIIEKVVYKGTCVALNALLVTNVTNFVNDKLNPALAQIAASQPSAYPDYGDRYLDWNQSVVPKVHHAVDKIRGLSNLPDFVRCMVNDGDALYEAVSDAIQLLPWEVALPETVPLLATEDMSLALTDLSLAGVDTLQGLEILEPLAQSKVTMRSALSFEELALNVSLRVKVQKTIDGQAAVYDEVVQVRVALADISAVVDLVVAFDDHFLQSMYLDQLSNLGCWVQPLAEISIPNFDLHLNPTKVTIQEVSGNAGALEGDITALIDNALLLLLSPAGFNQLVQDVLHGAVQGPLRSKINQELSTALLQIRSEQPCLSHYPYNDEVNLIDWRYSKIVTILNGLLNEYLGPAGVNKILSCATRGTGSISVETRFINVAVSGLNSFYAFSLLAPLAADSTASAVYELTSVLGLGFCDPSLCNPLTVTISGSRALIDSIATSLSASLARSLSSYRVSVALDNLYLSLTSLLAWDFNKVRDLQQKQLSETGCFPATIQNASLQNASLTLSSAQLSISTVSQGVQATRNITGGLSALLAFLTEPAHLARHNAKMENNLQSAAATCANGGVKPAVDVDTDGSSSGGKDLFLGALSWQWELFVLCVACTACLAALLLAYNYWGSSHPHGKGSLSGAPSSRWRLRCLDYGAALLDYESEVDEDDFDRDSIIAESLAHDGTLRGRMSHYWHRWHCADALLFHRRIPALIRYSLPLVILGNIVLFIQSNMSADAVSVMVSVTTGTTVHDVGSIFDFGLGSTVHDMWAAGVYPLAVLIAFFSGAWPYVKLMVMLSAWVVPPGLLTKERRESMLVVLDMLGKWSLVDFFVMVLMLCAFYFELIVYPEVMVVTVTVKPAWGFYSFLLATMVSLGLGHTILACHRLVTEPKLPALTAEEQRSQPREALVQAPFFVELVDWDKQEELELLRRVEQEELAQLAAEAHVTTGGAQPNAAFESTVAPQTPTLGVGAMSLAFEAAAADARLSNGLVRRRSPTSRSQPNAIAPVSRRRAESSSSHFKGHRRASKYFDEALLTQEVRITRLGTWTIALILAASIFALLAGVWLRTMGFHFEGLTGYMLKSAAYVDYSYVSVGTSLPAHSGVPNSFAIRWLQASYFLFGVAMPLAFLLSLVVLWLVPLTLRSQRQLHVLSEVLNAWSTLDVFCVSIVAALLEIQQFAAFIVGDSCDGINQLLAKPTADEKLEGDDKCFDVQAYVKTASWVLFLAAALLIVLGVPSLAAAHATIKRRLAEVHDEQLHGRRLSETLLLKSEAGEEVQRRLLADEEALALGIGAQPPIDAPDDAQSASDLSRPLLSTFSSTHNSLLLSPSQAAASAPPVHSRSFSHSRSDGGSDAGQRAGEPNQKSLRWAQREERALQSLRRHRQQHAWFRAVRQHCTAQAFGQGCLQLLQRLGLVAVRFVSENDPPTTAAASDSVLPNEDVAVRSPVPQSPALHFADIYQSQLSPLPFPYGLHSQQSAGTVATPSERREGVTTETTAEPLLLSPPSLLTC